MQYPEQGFGYPWIAHRAEACLKPYHGGKKRHDDTKVHRDMTAIDDIVGVTVDLRFCFLNVAENDLNIGKADAAKNRINEGSNRE